MAAGTTSISVTSAATATGTALSRVEEGIGALEVAFLARPNDDDDADADDDDDKDAFVGISSVIESNRDEGLVALVIGEDTAVVPVISRSRFLHSATSIRSVFVPDLGPV